MVGSPPDRSIKPTAFTSSIITTSPNPSKRLSSRLTSTIFLGTFTQSLGLTRSGAFASDACAVDSAKPGRGRPHDDRSATRVLFGAKGKYAPARRLLQAAFGTRPARLATVDVRPRGCAIGSSTAAWCIPRRPACCSRSTRRALTLFSRSRQFYDQIALTPGANLWGDWPNRDV